MAVFLLKLSVAMTLRDSRGIDVQSHCLQCKVYFVVYLSHIVLELYNVIRTILLNSSVLLPRLPWCLGRAPRDGSMFVHTHLTTAVSSTMDMRMRDWCDPTRTWMGVDGTRDCLLGWLHEIFRSDQGSKAGSGPSVLIGRPNPRIPWDDACFSSSAFSTYILRSWDVNVVQRSARPVFENRR